ncbi:protein STICHEL-like 2 [Punica granatum]|uniref:Protein STICHEL-like 2 n=1 Tax=Punica granatum TaxID=22663 RepID=A0A6P8BZI3_PUNGR|nr:protein STICHEL-like 2 [Punica granatum]XP_031375016.1 protein STICHEL-like 2 [Punica granatum]XP_031375017.1 protein STICHEL-like 2 [Punica granatum]
MDGRRHSVDIPISKALVALRRVRSLRDPSTNSMSKFAALVDNVNWDTNSCNGISLQFVDCPQKGSSLDDGQLGREREDKPSPELDPHSGASKCNLISCEDIGIRQAEKKDCLGKKWDGVHKSLADTYHHDHLEDGFAFAAPPTDHLEGMDSCSATMARSSPMEKVKHWASARKSYQRNQRRECGAIGDLSSCAGSPILSGSDAFPEGSSQNTSLLFANEEFDGVDHRRFGCKVSCCWSRTPKFKCSNPFSDFEDNPLLMGDGSETYQCGRWDSRNLYNVESAQYSETPRSLGQKYRPKSFKDLVGQNVVARSLLGAISRGRVSSIYLFHGPRGTGKTSASRVFAAALNCLALEGHGPCGLCRECVVFYSGGSKDVREVDSVRLNRADALTSLIKSASTPPTSSRFKVFIMDECQLMREETWAVISNSLEKISRHSVFIMISPDLEKLPRSVVSRSQRYHFPKIKDADIASRLGNICSDEGVDFDQVALEFIAAKSNGSLRDAEMMLDQLSLLGTRITMSMAYELVGTVSDDDLLDLLDLALSSDTSNTVIKARELMRSRVDPVQLTSQLASLIMDILSGNCQEHCSEARRKFLRRHSLEADLHKLGHALKMLSETEKQLRTSKNQTTWLTVALLHLSATDHSSLDEHYFKFCSRTLTERDVDADNSGSRSIAGDSKKHFTPSLSDHDKSCCLRSEEDYRQILDSTWRRAAELCKSNSLKSFLRKHGKLSSLGLNNGMVVAELEFNNTHNVSRAEKSWKEIASSLQSVLGCNVEIRINLIPGPSATKCCKVKKASFNLFSCSRRKEQKMNSNSEQGSDSDCSGYTSEKPMIGDRPNLACCSNSGSQKLHVCHHQKAASSTLRNVDGNFLGMGNCGSQRSSDDFKQQKTLHFADCSEELKYWRHQVLSIRESGIQFRCCSRESRCQEELNMLETSQVTCHGTEAKEKLALSTPRRLSSETLNCAEDLDGLMDGSDVLCWRTPRLALRRTWHERQSSSRLMGWVLPCAAVK